MAKVQHKDLPDNQLHEPKGASLAPANSFLFARGDGTTGFRTIENADIAGLVTVSVDLKLVLDTTEGVANTGLPKSSGHVKEPFVDMPLNEWASVGPAQGHYIDSDAVSYPGDPHGVFVVNKNSWYRVEYSQTFERGSGSSLQRVGIRLAYSATSPKADVIAYRTVNDGQIHTLSVTDFVYLEEGDTITTLAFKTASGVEVGPEMPSQLPVVSGTLDPEAGQESFVKLSGLRMWSISQ